MKKLFLATTFLALSAAAAQAEVNLDVNLGGGYYEPAPVYVERPVYYRDYGHGHHHHDYDYGYWNRGRDDDHHDNGHHYGNDKGDHHR